MRLFSPWPELVDPAAARLLEPSGWTAPRQGYPTGAEWIARYLAPLAEALGGRVRYGARVTGVSRRGRDRLVDAGRDGQPFTVHVTGADGRRGAAGGSGGDRRVGHLAAAEPGGSRRAAGARRARGGRRLIPTRSRTSRPPEAFAGQAHGRRRRPATRRATAVIELARIARGQPGHHGHLGAAPRRRRRHLRRRHRRRAAASAARSALRAQAGRRGRPGRPGDRLPHRAGPADRRAARCWWPRTAGSCRPPTGWWC